MLKNKLKEVFLFIYYYLKKNVLSTFYAALHYIMTFINPRDISLIYLIRDNAH